MTTIHTRERRGLLRLLDRWLGPKQQVFEEIDPVDLEGLDDYLMRDIGLSLYNDDYPRRDIHASERVSLH